MASNRQIEIDVFLNAEQATKGLQDLGETSKKFAEQFEAKNKQLGEELGALTNGVRGLGGSLAKVAKNKEVKVQVALDSEQAKEGFQELGETSKKFADRFAVENKKLGEGLGSLTKNVSKLGSSFVNLDSTVKNFGKTSTLGFASLLPAVAGVAGAIYALYETYLNLSGAAYEAEAAQEAMSSASSDLQSRMEQLAEQGINLATDEMLRFSKATLQAEFSKVLLEKRMEGMRSDFNDYVDALMRIDKANEVLADSDNKTGQQLIESANDRVLATKKREEAEEALNKKLTDFQRAQAKANEFIRERTKLEDLYKSQTKDAIIEETKRNIEKRAQIQLMMSEIRLTDDRLEQTKAEIEEQKQLALITTEKFKVNSKDLANYARAIEASLEEAKEGLSEREIIAQTFEARQVNRLEALEQKEIEASRRTNKAVIKSKQNFNFDRIAQERELQRQLQQIRALELEAFEIAGGSRLEIIKRIYDQEIALANDNENLIEIARLRRRNAEDRFLNEEFEAQKQAEAEARIFALENQEFDLSLKEDTLNKELELLRIKYEKERILAGDNQSEITELTRREIAERSHLQSQASDQLLSDLKNIGSQLAEATLESAYASLVAGESFKDSVAQAIMSIGQQATVQSAFSFAESVARLASGDVVGAGLKAKAGLMYAGVATVAGVTANRLGVGGGGGGNVSSTSPTEVAQTTTPEREQASQEPIVYNINFSGAVIYDTKTSAEQAFADRLTQLQNRRRRGGVMRRSS